MERDTSQRRAIKRAFHDDNRPLSPQEVLEAAKVNAPGLGIATVYRSLKSFVEAGILHPVELPGETVRYELAGKGHHHHFHCRDCGKVFEIDSCAGDIKSMTPKGFTLENHEIVLYGKCAGCN